MKGILKQKTSRNRLIPFIIATLLLLVLSLQLQVIQIPSANAEQSQKEAEAYPATPEGVVEDAHRQQYEYNFPSEPYYFLKEAKCQADCGITVNSFTVKKLTQSKDKAKIKVEFDVVGTFCPGYIGEKEDDGNTLTKTKAGENEFDIFKTTDGKFDKGVIFYDLVRKKDKWKIVPKWEGCDVIYMSTDSTIKFIEDEMKSIKDDSIRKRNLKIINLLKGLQKTDK